MNNDKAAKPRKDKDTEIMTVPEVARFFGVVASTVVSWDRKGWLKPFRTLGGHRRYHRREVEEFRARRAGHQDQAAPLQKDDGSAGSIGAHS